MNGDCSKVLFTNNFHTVVNPEGYHGCLGVFVLFSSSFSVLLFSASWLSMGVEEEWMMLWRQPESNLVEGYFLSRELVGEVWTEVHGKAPTPQLWLTTPHLEQLLTVREIQA